LGLTLCSLRHTRHNSTTHHQGRAVVSSDNDDDDGSDGRAAGRDDVDWEDIQEEDEE